MFNDAEIYKNFYEVIGGRKFMAPSASAYHSSSINELATTITMYTRQHKCGKVFTDSLEVHLPDGNVFRPDLIVMTSENMGLVRRAGYGRRNSFALDKKNRSDSQERFLRGVRRERVLDCRSLHASG